MKLSEKELQNFKVSDQQIRFSTLDQVISQFEANQISFEKLVDIHKNTKDSLGDSSFHLLLASRSFFEKNLENGLISVSDVEFLFKQIQSQFEIKTICERTPCLFEYALKNFVFDKHLFEKLDKYIREAYGLNEKLYTWYNFMHLKDLPTLLSYLKLDEELIKWNSILKNFECLSRDQRQDLFEACQAYEQIANKLRSISMNSLEDRFSTFDKLNAYLSKSEKKNVLNI